MANYGGYGGNFSTTSYGAQGGADGGGFVAGGYGGGSQGGSQESPGAAKGRGNATLRPVTIKQLIDAVQPHPDAEFKIDGTEVSQLTFIGQIQSISRLATNTTIKIDDGTGLIEVKKWVNSEADPDTAKPLPAEGEYVRVWGRLKSFGKRHVGSDIIRPVTDFNEISMHFLEATAVHLYFTRGPPDSASGGVKGETANGMFVDSYGGANAAPAADGPGKKLPARTSAAARKVYAFMQSAPQNNEGLHVHNLAAQLGMPVNDVFKAGDELFGEGLIYTTVDDETWAILEY